MSKSEYEWVLNLCGGCHVILQLVCFLLVWNIFFCDRRQGPKGKQMLAGSVLAVWNLLASELPGMPSGLRYLVSVLLILGYVEFREKGQLKKTVFVLLLFYNLHGLSFLISNSAFQYTAGMLLEGLDVQDGDYLSQVYLRTVVNQWMLVACYGLVFLVMAGILKKILRKSFDMNWQDVLFLSVLNVAGGMFARIVLELSFVKMNQEVFMLFDERQEMIWKIPVIAIFIYAGEVSAIYIYQRYMELLLERQKHFVERQQAKALHRRLEEAENFYGSVRKVRHEMRNHMINIKGLAAGENYEELEHYIQRLDETIQTLDYRFVTGNPVTDVVINDKYQRALKAGIDFQVNFHYTQEDTIPVFDLGILLNNLLDNAIEACEKLEEGQRYITLSLKRKPPFWFLEVENRFQGEGDDWKGKEELPGYEANQKEERFAEHGIGLKNVQEIAERYLGGVDIKVEKGIFRITVMLQQSGK